MNDINTHKTQVTVQVTHVKVIDENDDSVHTLKSNGKLNVTESKNLAKNSGFTFVSKEVLKDTFEVDTDELLKLK